MIVAMIVAMMMLMMMFGYLPLECRCLLTCLHLDSMLGMLLYVVARDTYGQNRVWYISAGNELKFWLLL